jgi:hypothetical protein
MAGSFLRSELRTDGVSGDAVEALLDRISKSTEFSQSARSQEVLRYLCSSSVRNPEEKITEHQIGVSVFGWDPNRDSGDDTSVRVQISQLRKRLERYFAFEGAKEPIRIRLPKGSYSPVFEVRGAPSENHPAPVTIARPEIVPAPRFAGSNAMRVLIGTNLVTLVLALAFALLPRTVSVATGATPNLDQFWMAFRGRPAQVVLSDGNLVVLGEMLGREIPLPEYRSHFNPTGLVHSSISDEAIRSLADRVLPTHLTGTQDVNVFGMLSSLLTRYRVPVASVSAPDFQMSQLDNVILLGHPRVNPWIHLFDDQLNFRYGFDWKEHKGQIVNSSPAPGEQAIYTAEFGRHGYCVVACLPKPVGEGTAVLIYGSDLSSLEAGGKFATDEHWMAQLYSRLHVTARTAPRYIEVLLRTELLDNMVPGFDIVAYRLPKN